MTSAPAVTIVFPHQLFTPHPAIAGDRPVVLVEEHLFFTQFRFHKQKLAFHRASMKAFASSPALARHAVRYVEADQPAADIRTLLPTLRYEGTGEIHVADVVDDWLARRLERTCREHGIRLIIHPSPAFLTDREEAQELLGPEPRHSQTRFYIAQRKRLHILLDRDGRPTGGRWTFDTDNRRRYPADMIPPAPVLPPLNEFHREALLYVERRFGANPGIAGGMLRSAGASCPVTQDEAESWLNDFLRHRFRDFGAYEDAMVMEQPLLHHSLLSPLLNAGLITPARVLERVLSRISRGSIPLNSTEGFLRQLVGWREFVRAVYERSGRVQRTTNNFGFTRKLPAAFWDGNTGVLPVDTVVRRVVQSGYAHHIERLMVLGNFMLLCEIDPDDVYRWFMEMFVDAYDWVMVPNVYGMSQFADGGLMSTKPYISGSNYLMKMGNFPKGPWQEQWDALFWRFVHVHREVFLGNPRSGMMVRTFDRMPADRRGRLLGTAERFLETLEDPPVRSGHGAGRSPC